MEVNMRTSKRSSPILFAVAALAATISATAQAEYRCTAQALPEERRACELVKQGPDALRIFINGTRGIYGLYFYDYVTQADFDRWDATARSGEVRSNVVVRRDVGREGDTD
jgi:hypothetical protein